MNIIPMGNPAGDELMKVTGLVRVINLRGVKKPKYSIPNDIDYFPTFIPGGPNPKIKAKDIFEICKKVLFGKMGTVVVHCEHGQNRTGLIFCLCAMYTQRCTVFESVELFSILRPPGIQRQWVFDFLHRYGPLIVRDLNSSQTFTIKLRLPRRRRKKNKRQVIPDRSHDGASHSARCRRHSNVRKNLSNGRKSPKIYPEPKSQIIC